MNSVIVKIRPEYVSRVLGESIIAFDFFDCKENQEWSDFKSFAHADRFIEAGDFLVQLSSDDYKSLATVHTIDLARAERIGWYSERVHRTQWQLFQATSPRKLDALRAGNPHITFESFDKMRDSFRAPRVQNAITGGFGLCYSVYIDDYDLLFSKFLVDGATWHLDVSALEKADYAVLVQLFLTEPSQSQKVIEDILPADAKIGNLLVARYLKTVLNYLINNDYTMKDFVDTLCEVFKSSEDTRVHAVELKQLSEKFIQMGIPFESKNPIVKVTREVLGLAKSSIEKLGHTIRSSETPFTKTALFVVGMLHSGSRLNEQFHFDRFFPWIVGLVLSSVESIESRNGQLLLHFREADARTRNYLYVTEYIKQLNAFRDLRDRLEKGKKIEDVYGDIVREKGQIDCLESERKSLIEKRKQLKEEVSSLEDEVSRLKSNRRVGRGSSLRAKKIRKIPIIKLAQARNFQVYEIEKRFCERGYLMKEGETYVLTESGKNAGGETKSVRKKIEVVWPENIEI